ncbi:MAG: molecular chaperone DnaK [Leptospiraceae bacterium]|nr:MAG: molecular chaperone DnaK [Leptospiraceae bacterium]
MKKQSTYLSKQKLEEFKKILLEERARILKDLAEEEELFISEEDGDEGDLADIKFNNALLSRLSDLELEKLRMIERALEKIEEGTYGICEGTGKPIPEARLRAIPWTPYTVEYAEKLNKSKKRK